MTFNSPNLKFFPATILHHMAYLHTFNRVIKLDLPKSVMYTHIIINIQKIIFKVLRKHGAACMQAS